MLPIPRILASSLALCALALLGCGQRGPLYLPSEPAAAQRATLPQTVLPTLPGAPSTPPLDQPITPPSP